eukprot:g50952.t1
MPFCPLRPDQVAPARGSGKGLAGDDSQCLPLLLQLVQRFGALHKLNKAMAKHAAPSTGKLDLYHRLWLRSWSAVAEAVPFAARSVGRAVGNVQHSHALCGPSGRRPKTWSKSRENGADPILPSFPSNRLQPIPEIFASCLCQ